MDINKYLSKKFLLSAMLFAMASFNIVKHLIDQYQFQWVVMATAVSYLAAMSLTKYTETSYSANGYDKATLLNRLKELFSREFILAVGVVMFIQILLVFGLIGGAVWFAIASAIAGAYNIGNSVGKI